MFVIPPVIAENSNVRDFDGDQAYHGEPVMMETFSMLVSNGSMDETVENEYEEIYEYPNLRHSYQYLNEQNSENLLEAANCRYNSPEHFEKADDLPQPSSDLSTSTSPSTSLSSSSSQYVTHDQALNKNSQNFTSTMPKSPYVKWENSVVIAPQLDLGDLSDSEEPDSLNIELPVSEGSNNYVTTQFLNKAYQS